MSAERTITLAQFEFPASLMLTHNMQWSRVERADGGFDFIIEAVLIDWPLVKEVDLYEASLITDPIDGNGLEVKEAPHD